MGTIKTPKTSCQSKLLLFSSNFTNKSLSSFLKNHSYVKLLIERIENKMHEENTHKLRCCEIRWWLFIVFDVNDMVKIVLPNIEEGEKEKNSAKILWNSYNSNEIRMANPMLAYKYRLNVVDNSLLQLIFQTNPMKDWREKKFTNTEKKEFSVIKLLSRNRYGPYHMGSCKNNWLMLICGKWSNPF